MKISFFVAQSLDGILKLRGVTEADEGVYVCTAGNDTKEVSVNVVEVTSTYVLFGSYIL